MGKRIEGLIVMDWRYLCRQPARQRRHLLFRNDVKRDECQQGPEHVSYVIPAGRTLLDFEAAPGTENIECEEAQVWW